MSNVIFQFLYHPTVKSFNFLLFLRFRRGNIGLLMVPTTLIKRSLLAIHNSLNISFLERLFGDSDSMIYLPMRTFYQDYFLVFHKAITEKTFRGDTILNIHTDTKFRHHFQLMRTGRISLKHLSIFTIRL